VEVIVDRCAALDLHKDTVMACVRKPGGSGKRRVQQVREFRTWTSSLRELREWLTAEGVSQVAMEATGAYWKPVWHVLVELDAVDLMLCNAHHVKNLSGRKTDVADAVWLCQLLECGLLRGSFVPPREIAELRDLTRYRTKLVQDRTRETQRVQKLLEDANIKLDSVASDVLGKGARRMLEALIAGERDVELMADMALTRMRPKIAELRLALEGRFTGHHALMAGMHLRHIDELTELVDQIEEEVDRRLVPFAEVLVGFGPFPGLASAPPRWSSPRSASTCLGSPPPRTWRRGPGSGRATTSRPASAAPAALARATPRSAPRCAKRPGPQPGPAIPTWQPSSGGSVDASASEAKARPSSRSPTRGS
jgi:transposase